MRAANHAKTAYLMYLYEIVGDLTALHAHRIDSRCVENPQLVHSRSHRDNGVAVYSVCDDTAAVTQPAVRLRCMCRIILFTTISQQCCRSAMPTQHASTSQKGQTCCGFDNKLQSHAAMHLAACCSLNINQSQGRHLYLYQPICSMLPLSR